MITILQLQNLRRLVEEEGHSAASAAHIVGVSGPTARYWLDKEGVALNHRRGPDKLAQYGAYDRKTDQLVAFGTAREVAAQINVTVGTLWTYVAKGVGKYQIVRLEDGATQGAE